MKNKLFRCITFFALAALIISLAACARVQRPAPEQQARPDINEPGQVNMRPQSQRDAAPGAQPDAALRTPGAGVPGDIGIEGRDQQKAQEIANELKEMEPIEEATVVISGNTALIGIAIPEGYYQNEEEEQLKDELEQKVKNMVPGITNIAITDEKDMYKRINDLSGDMRNGTPMQGVTDEFTKLAKRIMPNNR